jgi:DNA-binding beta-propeller fold protein YncE
MRTILRKFFVISIMLFSPIIHTSPFLYVANGSNPSAGNPSNFSTVYVIDVATNSVVTVVDVGTPTNFNGLAITPDGKTVYVSCTTASSNGLIARIDVATNTHILPDIPLTGSAGAIAMSPNGLYAYVTCYDGNVNRINIAQNTVDAVINFSSSVSLETIDIAIAPNGLTAYVSNDQQVTSIDLVTNTTGMSTPSLPGSPQGIVVTSDNNYAYVAAEFASIVQLDITNRLAPTPTGVTISPPFDPQSLAISSKNGQTYLYATDFSSNTFTAINITDPTTPVVGTAVSTGSNPWVIVITPDGTAAYVTNNGSSAPGTVLEFNITNPMVPAQEASITVGDFPAGMAMVIPSISLAITGSRTQNQFLLQTDFINKLTWMPQIQSFPPVAYNIYRDAALTQLIATVPASGNLQYLDHDRSPNTVYTYYIAAVDILGTIYNPVSISL